MSDDICSNCGFNDYCAKHNTVRMMRARLSGDCFNAKQTKVKQMDEKLLKKELAEAMYDIEVEKNEKTGFVIYELITNTGGAVRDDQVAGNNPGADMNFNSKDYNFIPHIVEMGLGELLLKKIKGE